MARPTLHHPAVQFAIPLIVGIACYRGGEMVKAYVDDLPVKMVPMQAPLPALPPLSLPTVYIAGNAAAAPSEAATDLDSLFRTSAEAPAAPVQEGALQEASPAPSPEPAPLPQPTLCERMAQVRVDGVTAGGAFIDGMFYRVNAPLHDADAAPGESRTHTVIADIVNGKVRVRAGGESCYLEFRK